MPDTSSKSFGLAIAYLLPGFIGLWAVSLFDTGTQRWLGRAAQAPTTVGDFFFAVVASLGAGVFLSSVRWIVFDRFLNRTVFKKRLGKQPDHDFGKPGEDAAKLAALDRYVVDHYQYYQFNSNTAVALAIAYVAWTLSGVVTRGLVPSASASVGVLVILAGVEWILIQSAVGCLESYRKKTTHLLGLRGAA